MAVTKLLVLCKAFTAPGGVANFVRSILTYLPPGVEAEQISIGRPPGREGLINGLIAPFVDNYRLIRAVRRGRPDCVHLNPSLNWPSLIRDGVFMLTLRLLGARNILVFFHGWEEDTAERFVNSRLLRALFVSVFGRAGVTCVLASRFKNTLVEIGLPESRVQVVTTMFDAANFDNLTRGKAEGPPVVTFLGRLVRAKGIFETIHAFAAVKSKHEGARLVVAGDGPALDELQALVKNLDISDAVTFAGYLKGADKAQTLLDSDLFVFPTYYPEGCPVSLLEAMAAGLPVITSTAGGIPDFFRNGVHGVMLEEIDNGSVTDQLEKLLSDPEALQRIGSDNAEYAWREFEPNAIVGKMMSFYAQASELQR